MAYRLQFRKDTKANWESVNPQLADGEIGLIRGTNLYKIGCPWTKEDIKKAIEKGVFTEANAPSVGSLKFWDKLPLYGFNGTLSQTLDETEGEAIDNEAVTKAALIAKFSEISTSMSTITGRLDSLELPDDATSLKKYLEDLSELVETQGGAIDEIYSRISAVETTINGQEGLVEKVGDLEGIINDSGEGEEKVLGLKSRVKVLEDKHVVCSKSDYDSLDANDIIPGVFYYVYEEEN